MSGIDEGKGILELQSEKLFDFLIDNAEDTSPGKKVMFKLIIQNIIDLETEIQSSIQELMKE